MKKMKTNNRRPGSSLPRLRALRPRPQPQPRVESPPSPIIPTEEKIDEPRDDAPQDDAPLEEKPKDIDAEEKEPEEASPKKNDEKEVKHEEAEEETGGEGGGGGGGDEDEDEEDEEKDEAEEENGDLATKDEPMETEVGAKVSEKKKHECKICKPPQQFPNFKTYLQHYKGHKQKVRCYECPHCEFVCQHAKKLQRHFRIAHEDLQDKIAAGSAERRGCLMCAHVAASQRDLENHQRVHHLKKRFFRCAKCSYVTHVRARYTKHVKYHSMPMIKCEACDFRTPYKWNLDRHTRNHGGGGTFQCRACNFTADIRQSLTVHEMNHHDPPVGQPHRKLNTPFERKPRNSPKRYNQVGASDYRQNLVRTTTLSPRSKSGSASTLTTPDKSISPEESDLLAGADCIALKCEEKGCPFITAWDSEMQRHLAEEHSPSPKSKKPLPMLIPLDSSGNSTPNNSGSSAGGGTTLLKVPRVRVRPELAQIARDTEMAKLYEQENGMMIKEISGSGDSSFEKKNASFFDKLKERLMTTTSTNGNEAEPAAGSDNDLKCWCTFQASSPEGLVNHRRTHHTALSVSLGSTRCPKCRRRCKSTNGLQVHMRVCHPGEFLQPNYNTGHVGASPVPFHMDWDMNFSGINSTSAVEESLQMGGRRRVFKCPHCAFWASTASRFHVHIVGHLNRKPFECSLCSYRSNWRWDITKHIKLKAARDPAHMSARVLMTDETGRRNYSKYNKYLSQLERYPLEEPSIGEPPSKMMIMADEDDYPQPPMLTPAPLPVITAIQHGSPNEPLTLPRLPPPLKAAVRSQGQSLLKPNPPPAPAPVSPAKAATSMATSPAKAAIPASTRPSKVVTITSTSLTKMMAPASTSITKVMTTASASPEKVITSPTRLATPASTGPTKMTTSFPTSPAKAATSIRGSDKTAGAASAVNVNTSSGSSASDESKRTLWKCKRCNFRDSSKESVLRHVKSHYDSIQDDDTSIYACGDCPFTAKDPATLAVHQVHHRPNLEAIFKCYLCPYYVSTKPELLEHARLHGEELAVVHQRSLEPEIRLSPAKRTIQESQRSSRESGNRSKSEDENEARNVTASPVPSTSMTKTNEGTPPPLLLDTRALPDAPLVWVSRPDGTLSKMLKCRHCPHVASRRAEVRDHESMHLNSSAQGPWIACPDCSFSCARRDVMDAHSEMHTGALGTVHCLVDEGRPDAQQLGDLATLLGLQRPPAMGAEPDLRDSRLVHCCSKCPARFLCEKELRIHLRYHSTELAYSCQWCSYAARQPAHLLAHQKAHSPEYQERTRYLLTVYGHSQRYPPPSTACVEARDQTSPEDAPCGVAWIVVEIANGPRSNLGSKLTNSLSNSFVNEQENGTQVFTCAKCPARYFRLDALEYHMTLHGTDNRFKCSDCDYSSKTAQNLAKHQVVHRRHAEAGNNSGEPAVSRLPNTPDPQFGILMRGNPNFVYASYLRNGRVKEKRYKCHKCPSAFEKREQYRVHLTLHGAKQRYRCDTCDYSVKYYANYVQHLKKHQANAQAQASRREFEDEAITIDSDTSSEPHKSVFRSGKSIARTAASATVTGIPEAAVSNQDKQSLMLMQRRGIIPMPNASEEGTLHCQNCPFGTSEKEVMDAHKRRHGIERTITPSCPHCDYIPRKDENVGEHVRLHFTRLYKPESYMIAELLALSLRAVPPDGKKTPPTEVELLFRECGDGRFLPTLDAPPLALAIPRGTNNLQRKVIVDPNTGEACKQPLSV